MHDKYKGFFVTIISGIIFGCMPFFAKLIYKNGGNAISLVFFRFLFSLPVLFLLNKERKISMALNINELKNIILVSIFGYSATAVLLFTSYYYISSGLATTLHFVYPVFVSIGCFVLYKEKKSYIKFFCAFLCSFGIVLFLSDLIINSIKGIFLALLSGISYAFYMLVLDKSNLKYINPFKLTFYLNLFSAGILFVYSLITKTYKFNITQFGWLLTIIFSIIITVGAVILLQKGIKLIGSQSASILSTTEPITSVIIGIFIFHEPINLKIIIGILLIICSVILLTLENKLKDKILDFKLRYKNPL